MKPNTTHDRIIQFRPLSPVLALFHLALVVLWAFHGQVCSARADEAALRTDFARLSGFPCEDEGGGVTVVPPEVLRLDGRQVSISGFMLPLSLADARVTEFLLLKDQNACCYGRMPRLNEWIVVRAAGAGVPPLMDVPVRIQGRLSVGKRTEAGLVTGLYFLDDARLVP